MKVQVATKFGCDFCGKTEGEVVDLILGRKSISICNECVDICVETVQKARAERAGRAPDQNKDQNTNAPKDA